jgi:hypothetical protein
LLSRSIPAPEVIPGAKVSSGASSNSIVSGPSRTPSAIGFTTIVALFFRAGISTTPGRAS